MSGRTKIVCPNCAAVNQPKPFGNWYFFLGMVPVVLTVRVYLYYRDAVWEALLAGLGTGIVAYTCSLVYVYFTVRFRAAD